MQSVPLPKKRSQLRPGALATFNETFNLFNPHVFSRPDPRGADNTTASATVVTPFYLPEDVKRWMEDDLRADARQSKSRSSPRKQAAQTPPLEQVQPRKKTAAMVYSTSYSQHYRTRDEIMNHRVEDKTRGLHGPEPYGTYGWLEKEGYATKSQYRSDFQGSPRATGRQTRPPAEDAAVTLDHLPEPQAASDVEAKTSSSGRRHHHRHHHSRSSSRSNAAASKAQLSSVEGTEAAAKLLPKAPEDVAANAVSKAPRRKRKSQFTVPSGPISALQPGHFVVSHSRQSMPLAPVQPASRKPAFSRGSMTYTSAPSVTQPPANQPGVTVCQPITKMGSTPYAPRTFM